MWMHIRRSARYHHRNSPLIGRHQRILISDPRTRYGTGWGTLYPGKLRMLSHPRFRLVWWNLCSRARRSLCRLGLFVKKYFNRLLRWFHFWYYLVNSWQFVHGILYHQDGKVIWRRLPYRGKTSNTRWNTSACFRRQYNPFSAYFQTATIDVWLTHDLRN